MSIRRIKSADRLYADVAAYDLVIVPELPLADALNRRLERPQFGTFATTPRRLAAGRREHAEDRTAFLELLSRTDHDWKALAHAVGNVLQCWEHQGSLEAILSYDAFTDETTHEVVDLLDDRQTTSGRLAETRVDGDRSVAVVAGDQLTTLERGILPPQYDSVDLFTAETFDLPPVHVFESATDIVAALTETIAPDTAENVAVVLDSGSQYASLVEAALESAGIPYYGGAGFTDRSENRAFLQLLRLAFRGSGLTAGEAHPVLAQLGIETSVVSHEKRLDALETEWASWLCSFRADVDSLTFGGALSRFEDRAGTSLDRFRAELETLGLATERLTRDRLDDLSYYLQRYEVPIDRENEGVLLADANTAAYVDRPVVFAVGLDEGWVDSVPDRPWVDPEQQFDRALWQFQVCLQSGTDQYYLVEDERGGDAVTPCLYFDALLAGDFERFTDLDHERHGRRPTTAGVGFNREATDVAPRSVETISQSSLNTYVNCPRDYFFSRLVDAPDQEHFAEGNLFHDFAEFYVSNPATVQDAGLDTLAEVMVEETAAFSSPAERPLRHRRYRIGLATIQQYLDENGPVDGIDLPPSRTFGENFFAAYFEEPVDSPLTEHWFEDTDLGITGLVDLVCAPDHLVDYKTGSKKRASQVVSRAATDPPDDTPNFQAALYLCYLRSLRPDEPLTFTFVHFLETMDDVIEGTAGIEDALTTVEYHPVTFGEYVGSRAAYDELCDHYNDCTATFEDLGYPTYSDIVDQLSFPETTDTDELRASAFAAEFTGAVDVATSADVDAEKGVDQAIRRLSSIRGETFFREDIDAFEEFVAERIDDLSSLRTAGDRFPVEGLAGEPNYRRVDNRDLILAGER